MRFLQGHAYFSIGGPVAPGEVPGGDFGEEMMRRSVLAAEILGVEYLVVHPFTVMDSDRLLLDESAPHYLTIEDAVTVGSLILDQLTGAQHWAV